MNSWFLYLFLNVVYCLSYQTTNDRSKIVAITIIILSIDNVDCTGITDIFYVIAIMIKELIDKDITTDQYYINTIDSLKQLITLSSDYGLSYAAERLYDTAITLLHTFRYNHRSDYQRSILSTSLSTTPSSSTTTTSLPPSSSSSVKGKGDDHIIGVLSTMLRTGSKLGIDSIDR